MWHIANVSHDEHPAVFPLEIPHRLVKLFSWHGETVFDPFAGIGTPAAAAVPLGRKVICVEQSRKYTKVARFKYPDAGRSTDRRFRQAYARRAFAMHFEAVSVMRVTAGECMDTSPLDRVFARSPRQHSPHRQ